MGEMHGLEDDLAAQPTRAARTGQVRDCRTLVEDLEDAIAGRRAARSALGPLLRLSTVVPEARVVGVPWLIEAERRWGAGEISDLRQAIDNEQMELFYQPKIDARSGKITAAEALGCSKFRLIFSVVLPNVMNPLIVVLTLEMAHAILLEAALSFLGFGVQPPLPSWGLMILEAKPYMFFSGWMILLPGAALFLLVLAIYLMGDGIRDVTAPENRN